MLRNWREFLVTNTVMTTFFPAQLNHSGCMYALENLANQAQACHHPETIFVTPLLWNVLQIEDMVTFLLWNFSRTVSSEGQWQCNTCAYQDMMMVKANHCSFCLPDKCLFSAHLEIIAVLEVYQCHFMGINENTFSCLEIL